MSKINWKKIMRNEYDSNARNMDTCLLDYIDRLYKNQGGFFMDEEDSLLFLAAEKEFFRTRDIHKSILEDLASLPLVKWDESW